MFSLDQLVASLGGELVGDGTVVVARVAACQASALILGRDGRALVDRPRILADDPHVYFARVARLLNPPPAVVGGIDATASVASSLPASVFVGAGACIGVDVQVGEGSYIGPGCVIGDRVRIGARCRLHGRVSVYADCVIGDDAIIHAGAVIGADGLGFAREKDGSWVKVPQLGRVVIGNDVEIGANTTIDRGALDDTVIEDGVKLDNLIQIAHNVQVGAHTIMAACSGVAGSTRIGKRCMFGGQAGISGHLSITDDVVVSADTAVTKSVLRPGVYTSNIPLQSREDWIKNFAHLRHLDAMAERIRALEQQLQQRETD